MPAPTRAQATNVRAPFGCFSDRYGGCWRWCIWCLRRRVTAKTVLSAPPTRSRLLPIVCLACAPPPASSAVVPRLPAPSLRPTPRRWACGRCLTAATRPLLRSGYSRWSGAIIASRSVRRAELRRDARGLPAWPFGRAVEHFFCTCPVWLQSVSSSSVTRGSATADPPRRAARRAPRAAGC